ncbi:MAG TPA: hypothetical protein VFM18_21980 [Methanosarcina sp.]|nr:hypothetical protein [Methanosarcina sp.]
MLNMMQHPPTRDKMPMKGDCKDCNMKGNYMAKAKKKSGSGKKPKC